MSASTVFTINSNTIITSKTKARHSPERSVSEKEGLGTKQLYSLDR